MKNLGFYLEPNNRAVYTVSHEAGLYRFADLDDTDRFQADAIPAGWRRVEMDTNGGWRFAK